MATRELPLPLKIVIQAKRYSPTSNVSSAEIQQYSSLRRQEENVDAVTVITTAGFTEQARQAADALNVKLVDINALCEMIDEADAHDLLNPYVDEDVVQVDAVTHEDVVNDVPLGDKTRSELRNHLVEGYGLYDVVPVEQYRDEETVLLVHSSSDSPVWAHEDGTKSLNLDTDTTERGTPVHLHLTSEGVWIFVRKTDQDAHFFTDYGTIVDVRADSALFGPNESVTFDLGDEGHLKYKFHSMAAEVRERFKEVVCNRIGTTISL